jgi:Metallo-peptidase family M12B Reprolysin-like
MRSRLSPFSPEHAVVRVIYFIPTDRQPEPDYRDRLDRVLTHVQQFYCLGMAQNGYGPMTFALDRHRNGALKIYEVQGKEPMRGYDRHAYDKVWQEVKEALAQQLNISRETIIIFQLLLNWCDQQAEEIGPYVGCGTPWSGTAWVYDDAKLDARLLDACTAGGYYGKPCSLGEFNSHYIGGVAHELGHAFGLPHDCERESDRPHRGYSLMSCGNHTYGQEYRGEGKGTFLSTASALPLSVHPLFTGYPKPSAAMDCQLVDLQTRCTEGTLTLMGRIKGTASVAGLVAHNDPQAIPHDYNAVGWTCPVEHNGQFYLRIGELKPGHYDLRLTVYGDSGVSQQFIFRYFVQQTGQPDLATLSPV